MRNKFTITKEYEAKLLNKLNEFKETLKTKKSYLAINAQHIWIGNYTKTGAIHSRLEKEVFFD